MTQHPVRVMLRVLVGAQPLVQILPLSLPGCVVLGKCPDFPEPQCSCL